MAATTVKSYDAGRLHVATGEADIDVSAATYTAFQALLTVTPASGHALTDVRVCFDLSKATTGFKAGYTTETIQFVVARKIDGTNWRSAKNTEIPSTALAGDDSNLRSVDILVGDVGPTEAFRIEVKLSAEQGDVELPYVLTYKSGAPATITAVAA